MNESTHIALVRRERALRAQIADVANALRSPESGCDRVGLLQLRTELIDAHIRVSRALERARREARRETPQRTLPL
jgi:hypothetical protein